MRQRSNRMFFFLVRIDFVFGFWFRGVGILDVFFVLGGVLMMRRVVRLVGDVRRSMGGGPCQSDRLTDCMSRIPEEGS